MNSLLPADAGGMPLRLRSHRHRLAAALALAFSGTTAVAEPVTHVVTTCADPGISALCDGSDDGTLRKAFTCAQDGDTVDLTQLQCSTITLSAPLDSGAANLTLVGPGQNKLTLDGGGATRIFAHHGDPYDSLSINDLTIANGYFYNQNAVVGGGGCIYTTGRVVLNSSTVTSCYETAQVFANGGAIYARSATLNRSTVSGNSVQGGRSGAVASGGGIYANIVELDKSTVSGNTAASTITLGLGGGIYANTIRASRSTISGNRAQSGGGAIARNLYLTDSTISGNQAPDNGSFGGVYAASIVRISGSTIARNSSGDGFAAGLFVPHPTAATVTLESTIFAGNIAGGTEFDIGGSGTGTIFGHNNLIMAHQAGFIVPGDTLTADPLLTPLGDNGGPTPTHALLPGSPAINHGSNDRGLLFDQRGRPREVGGLADIGAYEFDPDSIFTTGFGP